MIVIDTYIYCIFCHKPQFFKKFQSTFFWARLAAFINKMNKKAQKQNRQIIAGNFLLCFYFSFFFKSHSILDVIRHFYRFLRLESRWHHNWLKKVIYTTTLKKKDQNFVVSFSFILSTVAIPPSKSPLAHQDNTKKCLSFCHHELFFKFYVPQENNPF